VSVLLLKVIAFAADGVEFAGEAFPLLGQDRARLL